MKIPINYYASIGQRAQILRQQHLQRLSLFLNNLIIVQARHLDLKLLQN